jgi:hypothetical protein
VTPGAERRVTEGKAASAAEGNAVETDDCPADESRGYDEA